MGVSVKMSVTRFRIRTSVPRGRNTWDPDTNAKVQESLFATVAMLAAASEEAEKQLMETIADAKAGKVAFPAAS